MADRFRGVSVQAQNGVKLALMQQRAQVLGIARIDIVDRRFSLAFPDERTVCREKCKPARQRERFLQGSYLRECRMLPQQRKRADQKAAVSALGERLLERARNGVLPFAVRSGQNQDPHCGFPPIPM